MTNMREEEGHSIFKVKFNFAHERKHKKKLYLLAEREMKMYRFKLKLYNAPTLIGKVHVRVREKRSC